MVVLCDFFAIFEVMFGNLSLFLLCLNYLFDLFLDWFVMFGFSMFGNHFVGRIAVAVLTSRV